MIAVPISITEGRELAELSVEAYTNNGIEGADILVCLDTSESSWARSLAYSQRLFLTMRVSASAFPGSKKPGSCLLLQAGWIAYP